MAQKFIIRHDDFDFRLPLARYQSVHMEFVKRELIETANIQFSQFDRLCHWDKATLAYLKSDPYYDIQLHGWEHQLYSTYSEASITRDLGASFYHFLKFFGRFPTVWYPPWNSVSDEMRKIALNFDLKIDNESYDLKKFLREKEYAETNSVYFHAYDANDMALLPQVLDIIKERENK